MRIKRDSLSPATHYYHSPSNTILGAPIYFMVMHKETIQLVFLLHSSQSPQQSEEELYLSNLSNAYM